MVSWKRKLRMGMVGGGQGAFIGGVHRMVAALDQQIELAAGCFSQNPANTRETGAKLYLDPKRCYRSYQEMAESEARLPAEKRIDFVSVVTPNNVHFPVAKKFLETGFHVVCDKPLTSSLDEARELAGLVQKTGLVFALTHNYTGAPLVRHARELFRTGEMGAVRKVIVEYLQDWLATPQEKQGNKGAIWRLDPKQAGQGGGIGDIGSHALNLMEYITGDPVVALCSDKSIFIPDRLLDDDVNVLLRFKGGGKGTLTISQIAIGEENNLNIRIYGSEGAVRWAQENPNYLEVCRYGQPRQILTRGSGYLTEAAKNATRIPGGHPEGYLESFANIYCGAVEAIRAFLDGKPLPPERYSFPTVLDGVRGLEFIEKAVESSAKGSVWLSL
jgi:predicted dehydrogenase